MKKGFEFSFSWIFAIIVGSVIIFLAVYASTKLVKTQTYQADTLTAKQLSIIFEPLETGLASGKKLMTAELTQETRVYNECFESDYFGKQEISLSSKSGFGDKWQDKSVPIEIPNKYIFSDSVEQGEKFYIFSKTFEMPYKVSDLVFFSAKTYCFLNSPDFIKEDVSGLGLENINIENCSASDVKVCFSGSSGCDITVSGNCMNNCENQFDYGYVKKQNSTLFYYKDLMYSAIFSSPEVYECNVKRLIKRLTHQALIFKGESDYLIGNCGDSLSTGLLSFIGVARNIKDSRDLLNIRIASIALDEQNDAASCRLW